MSEGKIHQIHVDVPAELVQRLKDVLPEKGMVSLVVRRLLINYLKEVDGGANPMTILFK